MKRIKLAILSPSDNNFSETFIKVHKEKINAEVYFYYNGSVPTALEGKGDLLKFGVVDRARRRFDIGLGDQNLSDTEKALYQSLKKNKIQVVLAEFGTCAAESLNVVRSLNLPLIVHFHGFDAHQQDVVEKYKIQYQNAFDYASSIVVVSNKMLKTLLIMGAPSSKLVVNSCSPNPIFFDVNRKKTTDNHQVVFIGRFVEKKGPLLLLKAIEKCSKLAPSLRFVMVGEGPLLQECINFARNNNLINIVEFPGKLEHIEVVDLLRNSICYAQHSITAENGDSEGTPVAILEAGAAALPIVSTRHAGICESVVHEETGFLVDEGDVDSMANYIMWLYEHPNEAIAMGMRSREYIKNNYSEELKIAVLDRLVKEAVGNG